MRMRKEKRGVRIVQLITRTEPHRENLKDDYNKVSVQALKKRKTKLWKNGSLQKIPTFYINMDKEYKTCPEMKKWTSAATATK